MPNLFTYCATTHSNNTALTLLHLSQHILTMHLHTKTFCETLLFSSYYWNSSERSTQ